MASECGLLLEQDSECEEWGSVWGKLSNLKIPLAALAGFGECRRRGENDCDEEGELSGDVLPWDKAATYAYELM